jgi:hypothetical protein
MAGLKKWERRVFVGSDGKARDYGNQLVKDFVSAEKSARIVGRHRAEKPLLGPGDRSSSAALPLGFSLNRCNRCN